MDIYSLNNDYHLVMLQTFSSSLQRSAERAAAFYITDNIIKHGFLKDIDGLCNYAHSVCSNKLASDKEKNDIISHIKNESKRLKDELFLVARNQISKYLYIEAERVNHLTNIVVKGAALVGGLGQMTAGYTLMGAPFVNASGGFAYGMTLVAHGANNVYESLDFFVNGNVDSSGYVRDFYRGAAGLFGGNNRDGDAIYAIVDLGLSMKTTFGRYQVPSSKSLISKTKLGPFTFRNYDGPHDGRLFNALDAQYKRGISNMTKFAISLEIINDTASFSTFLDNI